MHRPNTPTRARHHSAVRRRLRGAAAAAVIGAPALVAAQSAPQQVVRGPIATYWVTADTTAGLGAMSGAGLGGMLGMLGGRAPSAVRSLDLRLGSTLASSGPPAAAHAIPPGLAMGASLPLLTPEPTRAAPPEPGERDLPQGMEQPKGRMLIFWGCGEKAGPGQPVVIDFSKIGAGQSMPNLVSRSIRLPRGPSFGTSKTYGAWPNETDRTQVPANASLRGEHLVKGNYSPDIRFVVERQDFMAPVELTAARTPAGSQQLSWKAIEGATGYFMSAFGAGTSESGGGGTDIVMWTSSAVQEMGGSLTDHLPPAEVARMIRERVVLPPQRTDCQIPAEATAAMPAGMLNFIAYGDQLDVVFPPRPADPKVPWEQQYAVKLRLKSTSLTPLGEGLGGMSGAGRGSGTTRGAAPAPALGSGSDASAGTAPAGQPAQGAGGMPTDAVEQGVKEGVRVLRGLFGR